MKKKILNYVILFAVGASLAGAALFVRKNGIALPGIHGSASKISYHSPIFSSDGAVICFVKLCRKGQMTDAEIWSSARSGARKKKLTSLPLRDHEEVFLDSLDSDRLSFRKINLAERTGTSFIGNISSGECKALGACTDPCCAHSSGDVRAFVEKGGQEHPDRLVLLRKEEKETLMAAASMDDSLTIAGWNGDYLIFYCHTPAGALYQNRLWAYSLKSAKLTQLAEDAENAIFPPAGGAVAYLVPLYRDRKSRGNDGDMAERWQLSVINPGGDSDIVPVKANYAEDIELYGWLPDRKSFLFAKKNFLCLYDAQGGEEKKLLDSEQEGWWGYPVSPYYTASSPDSRRMALLCYALSPDTSKVTEKILILTLPEGARKVIHSEELIRSKFSNEWAFHRHISWSPAGDLLVFEGKKRNDPERSDIYLVTQEGGEKRILSKKLFKFMDL